jgi:hypothetical protein
VLVPPELLGEVVEGRLRDRIVLAQQRRLAHPARTVDPSLCANSTTRSARAHGGDRGLVVRQTLRVGAAAGVDQVRCGCASRVGRAMAGLHLRLNLADRLGTLAPSIRPVIGLVIAAVAVREAMAAWRGDDCGF